jgi:hypothetical protein
MKKYYLTLAVVAILALAATSCNLPFKVVPVSNDVPQEGVPPEEPRPPEEFRPEEGRPPEEIPPGENRPPEEIPPEEGRPPEEMRPPEQPPEGEPRGVIFGWDYIDSNRNDRHDAGEPSPSAGSIMPVYEGPCLNDVDAAANCAVNPSAGPSVPTCPAPSEVASAPVDGEGYYRVENLLPGTYCVGALRTVTLEPGQELEVSFPSPP